MVTPIRINEINGNTCPTDDEFCHYDEFYVDITVEKKANAEPRPVYIHTWGLECDDELLIERVKKEKCDPMFSPMYCGGQPMCLSEKYPSTVLTVPGTYRFRMKNNKPLNWDDDFAIERSEIHPEYAALWLQQQQLCCCQASK